MRTFPLICHDVCALTFLSHQVEYVTKLPGAFDEVIK